MSKRNPVIKWNPEGQPADPRVMLKRYREEKGRRGRLRRYRLLNLEWPDAISTFQATLEYLTDGLVFRDGTPVAFRAGDEMLMVYETTWMSRTPVWDRLNEAMGVLMRWIASTVKGVQLATPSGEIWRPQDGVPLTEWLQVHGVDVTVQEGEPDPTGVCRAVTRYAAKGTVTQILGHPSWSEESGCEIDLLPK